MITTILAIASLVFSAIAVSFVVLLAVCMDWGNITIMGKSFLIALLIGCGLWIYMTLKVMGV